MRIVYNIFFGISSKNAFEIWKNESYNIHIDIRYGGEDSSYVSGK
jgi:hypothetical protein